MSAETFKPLSEMGVTATQIISILSEVGAGLSVNQVSRKHGISDATYYNWKSKYGGMSANELKRSQEVEEENAKLKRMYADMALENAALKYLIEKKLGGHQNEGASGSALIGYGWMVIGGITNECTGSTKQWASICHDGGNDGCLIAPSNRWMHHV